MDLCMFGYRRHSALRTIRGGIMFGLAQTQPGETRGKWQTAAISMILGGIIVAVISLSANLIVNTAGNALKPV